LPVNVGGTWSSVQFTVLEVVAELPQASTAVKVLVCDLKHPLELMLPSAEVILVIAPQASVAVAEPRAASISDAVGLHAKVLVVPVAVMVGGVRSAVQVTVLEVVAELPHASTAVNVLI
jgi:hypothetical protein